MMMIYYINIFLLILIQLLMAAKEEDPIRKEKEPKEKEPKEVEKEPKEEDIKYTVLRHQTCSKINNNLILDISSKLVDDYKTNL